MYTLKLSLGHNGILTNHCETIYPYQQLKVLPLNCISYSISSSFDEKQKKTYLYKKSKHLFVILFENSYATMWLFYVVLELIFLITILFHCWIFEILLWSCSQRCVTEYRSWFYNTKTAMLYSIFYSNNKYS